MHLIHLLHDSSIGVTAALLTLGTLIYSIGLMLLVRGAYGVDRLALKASKSLRFTSRRSGCSR